MERHWSALILDSRKETYTRVFAGRLLHFLYNRLELFSSECVDYASIGSNFLKALDEVCVYMVPLAELYLTSSGMRLQTADILTGKVADPYFLHDYWQNEIEPVRKFTVLELFRSRAMNTAIEQLQKLRTPSPSSEIEYQVSRIYCYLYSVWPAIMKRDLSIEGERFRLPVSMYIHFTVSSC